MVHSTHTIDCELYFAGAVLGHVYTCKKCSLFRVGSFKPVYFFNKLTTSFLPVNRFMTSHQGLNIRPLAQNAPVNWWTCLLLLCMFTDLLIEKRGQGTVNGIDCYTGLRCILRGNELPGKWLTSWIFCNWLQPCNRLTGDWLTVLVPWTKPVM